MNQEVIKEIKRSYYAKIASIKGKEKVIMETFPIIKKIFNKN